jgi:hypothetical protein
VGRLTSRLRALSPEPQLLRQYGSPTLELADSPGPSEAPGAGSCIAIQPAR